MENPLKHTVATAPGLKFIKLIIVILFAGLIAAGFALAYLWNNVSQLQNLTSTQQQALDSQKSLLATQQQNLQQIQDLVNQNQQKRLRQLAESEYFIRLAALNLSYQNDAATAIDLLKTASDILTDPSLISLRQMVVSDLATLQTAPKVDVLSIVNQLTAVNQQVTTLPLAIQELSKSEKKSKNINQNNGDQVWWQRALSTMGNALQEMVIIRHQDNPLAPLTSPDQHIYLIQQLQLKIEQAQWAALHQQNDLYQASLSQAIDWIQQYFAMNANNTQSVIATLTSLKNVNLKPNMPDLSGLVKTFNDELNASNIKTDNTAHVNAETTTP